MQVGHVRADEIGYLEFGVTSTKCGPLCGRQMAPYTIQVIDAQQTISCEKINWH